MKTIRDRKGWHAAVAVLFAATVVIFSAGYVRASDANLFLQNYMTEENRVIVDCSNLTAAAEDSNAGQFTAMVSGEECPVLDVSTVEQKQEGITYYCLVDVSGSMNQEQMDQAKGVLAQICEELGEKDNMVIGAIGTTLETTGFLKDKEEIMEVVDGLTGESDYTAIYNAVIDSISVLQSNHNCNRKKCLVLISDGCDETALGTTQKEGISSVTNSKIPVYTVAVMRQSPNAQQKESAENLGAFARQSVGGKDYPPVGKKYTSVAEEFDAKEAGGAIVEDMKNGTVLTLDVSGIEAAKDELLLSVSFTTDTATYSDTMYLYAADLKFSSDGKEGMDSTETADGTMASENIGMSDGETETESGGEEPKPPNIPVYLTAAGVILILIGLLLVIFVCGRKKAKKKRPKKKRQPKGKMPRKKRVKKNGKMRHGNEKQGKRKKSGHRI